MKLGFWKCAVAAVGFAFAASGAQAADTSVDLTGSQIGQSFGNSLVVNAGGRTLTITAWYDTTSTNFSQGVLGRYSIGLGACNPNDGGPLPPGACASPEHTIDNHACAGVGCGTATDWVLIVFDAPVILKNVVLDPAGNNDTDANYFIGTGLTALTGKNSSAASIGFPELEDLDAGAPNGTLHTITFGAIGTSGSFLLIGAHELGSAGGSTADGYSDYFKIKSLTFDPSGVVAEPATWTLMILAFAGLAFARRRALVRV
ncbi:MAG: hypothetical protein U1E87_00805 [Alphaproteobacteria bacterium]